MRGKGVNPQAKQDKLFHMKRRNFLAGSLAGASGYSMMVNAAGLPPLTEEQKRKFRDQRGFSTIAPTGAKAGLWAPEPNMTLVDLSCDVFVAGGGLAGVCAALPTGLRRLETVFFLSGFFFAGFFLLFFFFAPDVRSFVSLSFSFPIRFSRDSIFFFVLDIFTHLGIFPQKSNKG